MTAGQITMGAAAAHMQSLPLPPLRENQCVLRWGGALLLVDLSCTGAPGDRVIANIADGMVMAVRAQDSTDGFRTRSVLPVGRLRAEPAVIIGTVLATYTPGSQDSDSDLAAAHLAQLEGLPPQHLSAGVGRA